MSNNVFANGRELSCKSGSGKSIAAFPDVCMTPPENPATPPGVPVPYPNTGMAGDTTSGSTTVKITGKEVMLKNKSYFKKSTGNEAGSAAKKGVVSSVNRGKVYFTAWSMDVKIEGENAVRHLDTTTHNHGSTPNALICPFIDSAAFAADSKHPCAPAAREIEEKCDKHIKKTATGNLKEKATADAMCADAECAKARKCALVEYSPNRCCNAPGTDKQMTPHHLVPSHHFVAHADRSKTPDSGYHSNKAPCLCVEGTDHSGHTEHANIGNNYDTKFAQWDKQNPTANYTVARACELGAEAAQGLIVADGALGCGKGCLSSQLKQGHADAEVKRGQPLPRVEQKRKHKKKRPRIA